MSTMKIAVFTMDAERSLGIGDFMMSFLLVSKEKGVECRPTSTGAIIEGDNETLLEILDHINNTSFSTIGNRVAISMDFDESADKSLIHSEIKLPSEVIVKGINTERPRQKSKSDIRTLHDKVVNRLSRYVREEDEFVK